MTDVHSRRPQAGQIIVEPSDHAAARRAAHHAAGVIETAVASRGRARVVFASAPSQEAMLAHLADDRRIDWSRVESFHMDEYLGLPMDRPQAFGRWLADRLPEQARPGLARLRTDADVADEIARYGALLRARPIDLTCLGVGVNGHIAFNEPGLADGDDPADLREVALDDVSRQQQVDDGLFATIDEVPVRALTLTVTALLSARSMVCTVLGAHKAPAVARALTGAPSNECPASFLTRHDDIRWFLDAPAASRLPGEWVASRS
jgi:glucosamine-6-phosphate deaminase